MSRHLKIIYRIASMSWQQMFIYPLGALVLFFSNAIYFIGSLIFIWYLFKLTGGRGISGYSAGQFFLVFGISELIFFYLFGVIVDSAYMFQFDLHAGKFDYTLIKPISPIFTNSFRRIYPDEFMKGLMALIVCLMVAFWMGLNLTYGQIVWALVLLLAGMIILYFSFWITYLLCFFQDRFYALNGLYFQLSEVTRMPKKMYPELMQWVLSFIFPVFLIANPVFNVLDGTFNWQLVGQVGLVMLMFGLIYFYIWKIGIDRYNSAN